MPADVAIQLEQIVALMFMITGLVFTKMLMIELKDAARLRLEKTLRPRRQMMTISTEGN